MSSEQTHSDPSERVRQEWEEATRRLAALEAEYATLLADPGVLLEDRDTARNVLETTREAVANAEKAMARVLDGTYGRCRRCGAAIDPERLEALPDADTCVSCRDAA